MAATRIAPPPGADKEFDDIIKSADEAMASDPAAAKISEEVRRETIARALAKYGRKTFAVPAGGARDPWPGIGEPNVEPDQAIKPTELRIPEGEPTPYWYDDPAQAAAIEHYILSRVALGKRMVGGLLVTGPAGSGKTMGVIKAVERLNEKQPELGLPLLVMNCPTLTDEQKWFGRREVDEHGTRYERSDFVAMVESGAVVLLDEIMRLHPKIHNPVMSLLDGQESVLLSDLNITITRHPRTVIIATTNIGAQYGGTYRMDWAMRERWSATIERDFPPRDEEIRILTSHNPGCDPDAASVLVDIAQKTRDLWGTNDLRSPISTRTLDNAAFWVASGMTESEALAITAVPEYDGGSEGTVGQESERSRVEAIIQGRTGR